MARELFSRHLFQHSKKGFYATRRALANHYEQLLKESHWEEDKDSANFKALANHYEQLLKESHWEEGKDTSNSFKWLELLLALVQQLLFLPDKANHLKIIEYILSAYYTLN